MLKRFSMRLALPAFALLSLTGPNASAQSVSMEILSTGCGTDASRFTDLKNGPRYSWRKGGSLAVSALVSENGIALASPKTAQVSVRGNLITLTIKYVKMEGNDLPPACHARTPYSFVISAIQPKDEDGDYVLLVAQETAAGFFRVLFTMRVEEPQ